jgi:hypothetical protein
VTRRLGWLAPSMMLRRPASNGGARCWFYVESGSKPGGRRAEKFVAAAGSLCTVGVRSRVIGGAEFEGREGTGGEQRSMAAPEECPSSRPADAFETARVWVFVISV